MNEGRSPARVVVSTSVRPSAGLTADARALADELGVPYHPRRNQNAARICDEAGVDRVLVVAADRLTLRARDGAVFFYHPNMALLRGLNVLRGWRDIFVEAAELRTGETVLDCTVGFAAEAMLAALAVGPEGRVVGLESVPEVAAVIRDGIRRFPFNPRLQSALQRVEVVTADYRTYLAESRENSYDLVYFDPFFSERLRGSEHTLDPLHAFGNTDPLDASSVIRALAVARRRVIVKHSRWDALPEAVEERVTRTVTARKSQTLYRVIDVAASA